MKISKRIYLFIGWQFLLIGFLAAVLVGYLDKNLFFSLLVGSLLGVFSNCLFALCFFSTRFHNVKAKNHAINFGTSNALNKKEKAYSSDSVVKMTLYRFYTAEIIKLFFVFVAFGLIIKYTHLSFLPLLVSYLLTYLNFSLMGLFFL